MARIRAWLWLTVLAYFTFIITCIFVAREQGKKEHGERKRRFTMPQNDTLGENLRRNVTEFLLSIEATPGPWNETLADDTFVIFLPFNSSHSIITGILIENTTIITESVVEDIIPNRDFSDELLYDYFVLIISLLGNQTNKETLLDVNNITYHVVANGMMANYSVLIAFEFPQDYQPDEINDLNWNQTYFFGDTWKQKNNSLDLDILWFPDNYTSPYSNYTNQDNSTNTRNITGVGYSSGFARNWNAFSGYRHFQKSITVSTYPPPKRKNKDKKPNKNGKRSEFKTNPSNSERKQSPKTNNDFSSSSKKSGRSGTGKTSFKSNSGRVGGGRGKG